MNYRVTTSAIIPTIEYVFIDAGDENILRGSLNLLDAARSGSGKIVSWNNL